MRWEMGRRSDNVEDRRGMRPGRVALGGGIGGVVLIVIALLLGVNPQQLLQEMPADQRASQAQVQPRDPAEDRLAEFVSVVLADTEDVWRAQFQSMGRQYREPKLVLFTEQVDSACGVAGSSVGPFYCPGDEKVYIDLAVLPGAAGPVRRAGRFRPGLRDRPRDRPPRPEPPGDQREGPRHAAAGVRGGGERAVRAPGVAGGFLRRRLGAPRPEDAQHPGAG